MADITPNIVVSQPSQLFTLARSFKANANGKIYIGQIDTDPTIPSNQIQVYLENEDGSHVPVAQPIVINAGGYPVYNGQIAKFVTVQGHSMAIYDAYNVQQFYFPNVLKYDPDQFPLRLIQPDGAAMVGAKPINIPSVITRTVQDALYDTINVKWFGAIGDFNPATETGTNNSPFFQAALNYIATLGSRRSGRGFRLYVPAGNYLINETVHINDGIVFGVDIVGDGPNTTTIRFNQLISGPGIYSHVEFINFDNIALLGTTKDSNTSQTDWRESIFYGKLDTNMADIDVSFGSNCYAGYAKTIANVVGRGAVFKSGCVLVYSLNVLTIDCSPDTVFTTGADTTSLETGMRNYSFVGVRTDVVSRVIRVSGTGSQKEYINGITISACQFNITDRLIDADDATIRGANIDSNNSTFSFAGGVITGKNFINCSDVGNNWKKGINPDVVPTNAGQCIEVLWRASGYIHGFVMDGTIASNIKFQAVISTLASKNVSIRNCHFHEMFSFNQGNTNNYIFFSSAASDSIDVSNNTITASVVSGTTHYYNDNTTNAKARGNTSEIPIVDGRMPYTPIVYFGTTAAVLTTAVGRYEKDGSFVNADIIVSGTKPASSTADIAITLPSAAVASAPGASSVFSGAGEIIDAVGFSGAAAFAGAYVSATAQRAYVKSCANMVLSNVNGSFVSSTFTLVIKLRYRY